MDDRDSQSKLCRIKQWYRKQRRINRRKRRHRHGRHNRAGSSQAPKGAEIFRLCRSSAQGNLEEVKRLIETCQCDPRLGTPQGVTALHCASYCGQLEVVKYLILEAKCDPTVKDNDGECPLAYLAKCTIKGPVMKSPLNHYSASSNKKSYDEHFHTALYLIRNRLAQTPITKDVKPKVIRVLRLPLLVHSSVSDQSELVESMVSILELNGINQLVGQEVYSCFKIAVEKYKYGYVELLIRTFPTHIKNAIRAFDRVHSAEMLALLHKAFKSRYPNVIKFLIELVNDTFKPTLTCFREAIRINDCDIVYHLIQSADSSLLPKLLLYTLELIRGTGKCIRCHPINFPNTSLNTILELISFKCISLAGFCIKDAEGNNPLHLACGSVHPCWKDIIACINEANSNYQLQPNSDGKLPLHIACEIDHEAIELISSERQLDINTQDKDGSTPLHVICKSLSRRLFITDDQVLDCFKYLIVQKKSNVNIKDNAGKLPVHVLLESLAHSDVSEDKDEELLNLCSDDASVNVQDNDGNTPLHIACTYNVLTAVDFFASKSCCNKNLPNGKGYLPIHCAVSSHLPLEAVKAVNDRCAWMTTQGSCDESPLYIAFKENLMDIVEYFIESMDTYCLHGSHLQKIYDSLDIILLCTDKRYMKMLKNVANDQNINQTANMGNRTPIHVACTHKNLMAAVFLTEVLNCDLSCRDSQGRLPLHIACSRSLDFVKLTSQRCDVNLCDDEGRTPLHVACQAGSLDIVQYLVQRSVCEPSKLKRDHHNMLPADYACKHSLEIVVLVSPPCSMLKDIAYNDIKTTLDFACSYGSLDVVRYLINQNGYTLSALEGSHSALFYACGLLELNYYGSFLHQTNIHKDVVEFLISKCGYNPLKVYLHNSKFVSIFHYACHHKHLDLMKASTIHSINLQDSEGNTPLHYACKYKCTEIVQFLVNSNSYCDQTVCNKEKELALHIACRASLDIVRLLSTEYDTINSQNEVGNTPLHIACTHKHYDIVKYLLKQQLCLADVLNEDGNLALHNLLNPNNCLIKDFFPECSSLLSKKPHDTVVQLETLKMILNRYMKAAAVCNKNGLSPMHIAILKEEINFFEILSESGYCFPKKNVLHLACLYRKPKVVQWLIKQGTRKSVKSGGGNLPQHLCFMGQRPFCLQTLIQLGRLDICRQNEDSNTIIHMVCKMGKIEVLRKILECGDVHCADVFSIQNNKKDTPLHLAVANCKSAELVELVATSDNVNMQNIDGDTPVHIACHQYVNISWFNNGEMSLKVIVFLISKLKSSVEVLNNDGNSPFHILLHKTLSKVSSLIQVIPKTLCGIRNKQEETILHVACINKENFPMVISHLIKSMKFTTDTIGKIIGFGATALHLACITGDLDTVQLLVDCDPLTPISDTVLLQKSSQCMSGDTALHIACRCNNPNIVRYLLTTKHKKAVKIFNTLNELPIHLACHTEKLLNLFVGFQSSFDCNTQNSSGNTVLHVACGKPTTNHSKQDVVAFLLYKFECKTTVLNNHRDLPLHIACQDIFPSLDVIKMLSEGLSIDEISQQNDDGNTPLHLLLSNNSPDYYKKTLYEVVKFFTKKAPKLAHIPNNDGKHPIHLACHNHSLPIVKHLYNKYKSSELPSLLLHEACHNKDSDVMKYMITKSYCHDINLADTNGDIPLHLAIRLDKSKECIHELIKLTTNINLKNRDGNTPLHEACVIADFFYDNNQYDYHQDYDDDYYDDYDYDDYYDDDDLCDKCKKECTSSNSKQVKKNVRHPSEGMDAESTTDESDIDSLYALKALLGKEAAADLSIKNLSGKTPLHCLSPGSLYGGLKLVVDGKSLKFKFDANLQDQEGLTLLHIACKYYCHSSVDLLLSSARADPSIEDNQGQTPITLTDSPHIIKVLIKHGADPQPLYQMHSDFFQKFSSEKPPPTPVNLIVIGHPDVGKTTLIQSLQSELNEKVISENFGRTAGVVPTNFNSQVYGEVTFYDFAGQPEYYASHDTVIHRIIKNVPPIVLIIVDLNKSDNIIHNQLHYWIGFIDNRCTSLSDKAHLIVIGSHADHLKVQGMNPSEKISQFDQFLETKIKNKMLCLKGLIGLNCTKSHSVTMTSLRNSLQESTNSLRKSGVMQFNSHCFYVFLLQTFKDDNFVTLKTVISTLNNKAKDSVKGPLFVIPSDQPAVIKLCQDLDEKGHLMYIEHPIIPGKSWLILDKLPLLKIIGDLFAPVDFPQQYRSTFSTGVVPRSQFDKELCAKYNYPSSLSLAFLSRMEYCREITDKVVLESIYKEEETSETEKYYFFPNLVSLKRPTDIWNTDSEYSYKCGWLIQCTMEGELFSPQFIQALLLRLTFLFTPKKTEYDTNDLETYKCNSKPDEKSMVQPLVIKRLCSVWNNGIYWQEESGVKMIVDIIHQRTLVLQMQCIDGCEIELVRRRSQIISMTLNAKEEFCSRSKVIEYFIHPKCVTHSLPNLERIQELLFSFPRVKATIINKKACVINEHNKTVKLEDLLYYEPYSVLSKDASKSKMVHNYEERIEQLSIFRGRQLPQGYGQVSVMSAAPKFHQLDLIEGGGKSVRVIQTAASKWEQLATRLYFEPHDISRIEVDNPHQCNKACSQVCSEWLDGAGRKPITWTTLIQALKEAKLSEIAMDLESIIFPKIL